MTDDLFDTRKVGDLTVRIDTTRCAGYMACRSIAPEAFELGDGGVISFAEPEETDRQRLLEACSACPVQALSVLDAAGTQLIP